MRFFTETGSTYIVDPETQTIRRDSGQGEPTDRIASGRKYVDMSPVKVGSRVMIVWGDDTPLLEGSPSDATPTTITSRVVGVEA